MSFSNKVWQNRPIKPLSSLQILKDTRNINTGAENTFKQIALFLNSITHGEYVELMHIQTAFNLFPFQGCGDGSTRFRTDTLGCRQGLSLSILEKIQVDLPFPLVHLPLHAGQVRKHFINQVTQELSEIP